ncbi:Adaptin ear-binding coat-associated protein 1 [Homalodisca vitripennis]|nr:Adaptin ear-binding coat-associated protein 1 [Homalodisca vitripennis]
MESYESVLLVKSEVFVFKLPPRATNRAYRAADWNLTEPQWTGRMRLVTSGKDCILKLEDKNTGELFAKCPIDKYPGVAVESVSDSSRYFVLRIQDDNNGKSNISDIVVLAKTSDVRHFGRLLFRPKPRTFAVCAKTSDVQNTEVKVEWSVDNVIAESRRPFSWCVALLYFPHADVNERKTSLEIVPISKISNSRGADHKLNCNGKAFMYRAKNLNNHVIPRGLP